MHLHAFASFCIVLHSMPFCFHLLFATLRLTWDKRVCSAFAWSIRAFAISTTASACGFKPNVRPSIAYSINAMHASPLDPLGRLFIAKYQSS